MTRKLIRVAAYGLVLAIAVGGVYVATRKQADVATARAPAAVTSAGDVAKSVMLTSSDTRRIGVTYATATEGPLVKEVRTVGQVVVDETKVRAIAPRIDGWVERLVVDATGQHVSAGQSLLTIYSPMLVSTQEELLLALRLQHDLSAASGDVQGNAAELISSARRRLAYWDIPESEIAEIERTGKVSRTLTLRAPSSGYVLEKNVVVGQKIMAGDALFKVVDLSDVWIEGQVFEQDLAGVRVGQTVHADFQALPGEHRMGTIAYIYPTLDAESRTARVRVVMSNRGMTLKPGMYATIRIVGGGSATVLSVPRSAVLSTGERSIVFVHDATGHLTPREVLLGRTSDDRVEILRGLSAGQSVVSSATFLVDAESNLGTALGGMGNMPGMDMTTPPKPLPMAAPKTAKPE